MWFLKECVWKKLNDRRQSGRSKCIVQNDSWKCEWSIKTQKHLEAVNRYDVHLKLRILYVNYKWIKKKREREIRKRTPKQNKKSWRYNMDSTIEGLMNHYLENCGKDTSYCGFVPSLYYFPLFFSFAYLLNHYPWVCLDPLHFYSSSSSLVLSMVVMYQRLLLVESIPLFLGSRIQFYTGS